MSADAGHKLDAEACDALRALPPASGAIDLAA